MMRLMSEALDGWMVRISFSCARGEQRRCKKMHALGMVVEEECEGAKSTTNTPLKPIPKKPPSAPHTAQTRPSQEKKAEWGGCTVVDIPDFVERY